MAPDPNPEWFTFEVLSRLFDAMKDPDVKARLGALDDLDKRIAAREAYLKSLDSTFRARLVEEWQGFSLAMVGLFLDCVKVSALYLSLYAFHALTQLWPMEGSAPKTLHAIHGWAVVGAALWFVVISFGTMLRAAGMMKRKREP